MSPFTDFTIERNNTPVDDAKYIEVTMAIYNLTENSNNYSKTSGGLWQYYRDDPNDNITQSGSFSYKIKIKGKTSATENTKYVEIAVPLKYLSNFWTTLEMVLINCEINLILCCCEDCVISSATGAIKFKITETKLYVPVVTLSTRNNLKLLQNSNSGFKRTINWNKYQTKVSKEKQNEYLDYLIDLNFQGMNKLLIVWKWGW